MSEKINTVNLEVSVFDLEGLVHSIARMSNELFQMFGYTLHGVLTDDKTKDARWNAWVWVSNNYEMAASCVGMIDHAAGILSKALVDVVEIVPRTEQTGELAE